jgi:hypothetical protein
MSYGFEMGFCSASSFPKALEKAHKAVKILGEYFNATKYIEENSIYSPVRRGPSFNEEDLKDHKLKFYARTATEKWVRELFSFRFVYFKEQKLLGMLWDYHYPEELKKMFKTIYFQNSCDQDYEREDWKNIKVFTKIYDECMLLDATTFCDEFRTLEEAKRMLDYYRRSAAYDKIFETLGLNNWLYGHCDDKFKRFTLSALETGEETWKLQQFTINLFSELDY